jgi:hypothetical protein
MTIQIVNTGTSANSGNGDSLRTAFTKINNNFRELSDIVGNIDRIEDVIGNLLSTSTQTGISITYNSTTNVLSLSVIPATTSTIGGVIVGSGLSVTNSGQLSANFGDIVITNNVISTKFVDEDIILRPAGTASSAKVRIVNHGLQFDNGTGGPYTGHLIYTNPTSSAGIGVGESNNSIRISGDTVTLGLIADFGLYNAIRGTWNSLITMDYFGNLVINDGNLVFGNNGIQFSDGSTQYTAAISNSWQLTSSTAVVSLDSGGTLTVPGHIIPNANLTYDLGSTSSQWHSIYVGTGTIYIGGVALGVNTNSYVTINGSPIITLSTTGNLTLQGDVSIGTIAISDTAPIASTGTQWFNTVEGRTYIAWNNSWIDSNPTQVLSPETYLDGLAIDGTIISTANVDSDAIVIDGGDNTKLTVSNNSIKIQTPSSEIRPFWVAEYGGITTAASTSSVAIGTGAFYDSQGNVYVLGAASYGEFGPFSLDSLLLKYDTNGNLLWNRTWHDDSGANCGAVNQAFAIDSNDRIYWLATASVSGFGCWTGYMDTDGNLGLGGIAQNSLGYVNGALNASDIACDNSGNYYLAGSYYDDGSGSTTPVVIKINGDTGIPIWTGNIIPEDFEDLPTNGVYRAVTVNPTSGDVWAIGDYYDGGLHAMLSKWDVNGVHQWTKELVTTTGDLASAVIYNSGYVYTIVNDDPDQKAVVSKFNTDGVLIWASYLAVGALDPIPNDPPFTNTGAYDLSFDDSGNVYVTGVIPYTTQYPQLWITKLDPANGEMLYSRILATTEGSAIFDYSFFGDSSGHRVGDIYEDKLVVTAVTFSDIDDSTSTQALRVIAAQLPIDGSITGSFDNVNIVDITSELDSICSTGTYTVTTLVWSTGTATTLVSTSSISVSYITDIIGMTGETIALGNASGSTTTNTWTFVNNNIILPPAGDILDSDGNSVLGGGNSDYTPTTPADWLGSPTVGTVTAGLDELASRIVDIENTPVAPVTTSTLVNGTYTVALTTSGILTLSTASTILGNSYDPNVYIETSTTATTSTWAFGTNGILTLPANTPIIKGGGTGTDVTVIATTGTNTSTWVFAAEGNLIFPDSTVQTTAYTGATSTSTLVNGTYTVALSITGQLNLPSAANTEGNNARIQSTNSIDVLSNLSKWTFGTDGTLTSPVLTITTLPSATPAGQRAFISDAESSPTWGATVSTTGTNTYPVWSDGSIWKYG